VVTVRELTLATVSSINSLHANKPVATFSRQYYSLFLWRNKRDF